MNEKSGKIQTQAAQTDIYRLTLWDVFLVAAILLFTLVFVFRTSLLAVGSVSDSSKALLYQEGRLLRQVDLNADQDFDLLEGKMSIRVREGKISVSRSDCPRQVCVNAGWIRHPGESIACVPYKLLIELKSRENPLVDAVVY